MATTRALGSRQLEMLGWFDQHKTWHPATNGIVVGEHITETMRVLDSLARRHLVAFDGGVFRPTEITIADGEDTVCFACDCDLPAGAPAWPARDGLVCADCAATEAAA